MGPYEYDTYFISQSCVSSPIYLIIQGRALTMASLESCAQVSLASTHDSNGSVHTTKEGAFLEIYFDAKYVKNRRNATVLRVDIGTLHDFPKVFGTRTVRPTLRHKDQSHNYKMGYFSSSFRFCYFLSILFF